MSDAIIRVGADTRDAERSLGGLQRGLQALAIGLVTKQVVDYTAAWTDLNSRLVNATGSQEEARKALKAIGDTADRTYAPLQQTADVYLQNSLALTDLGYSTNEQIRLAELLNNSLAVSGSRGQDAASAINAFGKAVGEGRISTETLNTLLQKNPRLVKAMSESLGVTVGELRRMAAAGELETGPMLDRLEGQMSRVREEAKVMPATIADAMIKIDNAFLKLVGNMDEATGASAAIAGALETLAENLDVAAVATLTFMAAMSVSKLKAITQAFVALNAVMRKNPAVMLGLGAAAAMGAITAFLGKQEEVVELQEEQQDNNQKLVRQEKQKQDALARQVSESKKYFQQAEGQARIAGLFGEELEIRQAILAAANQLKIPESQLSKEVRDRAVSIKQMEINNRSFGVTQQALISIGEDIVLLAQQDTQEQQIQKGLLDYRRSVSAKIYDQNKNNIETLLRERQVRQEINSIEQGLLDRERQKANSIAVQLENYGKLKQSAENLNGVIRQANEINENLDQLLQGQLGIDVLVTNEYFKQLDTLIAINNALVRNRDNLDERIDKEYRLGQIQAEMARLQTDMIYRAHDLRMAQEEQFQSQIQKTFEIYYRQQGRSTEQAREFAQKRADFEKKTDQQKAQWAIQQGASVFDSLGQYNRQAFQAAKAFNIANAVMNTYTGATKALSMYPPPFNFIAAAAVVAAGLAQVAQIRSQNYSGRAVGGPVSGGTPYIVGEAGPEMFVPQGAGRIVPNSQIGGEPVNVTFNINTVDARGMDQLLMERKGMIVGMVRNAINDRGVKAPM